MNLTLHHEVVSDIQALPDRQVQVRAVALIEALRKDQVQGAELDWHPSTGDLRDCRKLLFDVSDWGDKPRFRLVYRVLEEVGVGEPPRLEVVAVEVIAVGLREDLNAYVTAADRLGRA